MFAARDGPKRRMLLGLIASVFVAAGLAILYYHFVYEPEQIRRPYRDAGLSDAQIAEFFKSYPEQNGNSTWVEFAKMRAANPRLADAAFKTFKNLNSTLRFLKLSSSSELLALSLSVYGERAIEFLEHVTHTLGLGSNTELIELSLRAYGRDAAEFLEFVKSNNYDGAGFLKEYPQLSRYYKAILPVYTANSTLFRTIYDQFNRDKRAVDKTSLLLKALEIYRDLNLVHRSLRIETIQAVNNLTIAYSQHGLPTHSREAIWLITNATQTSPDIVDFNPIVFKSVDGNHVYVTPNPPRETWLTVEILKNINDSGFNILNHPEMFLGLNSMIVTDAWCIFDDPWGIGWIEKEHNNRELKASDKDVINLILLHWKTFSQFAPQLGGGNKVYNRDFPWYNSTELKRMYEDKNELRNALFKLFYLDPGTYNIKEGRRVVGIKGVEIALKQSEELYNKIVRVLDDPKYIPVFEYHKGEIEDRFINGLPYTMAQFIGLTEEDIKNLYIAAEKVKTREDTLALRRLWNKIWNDEKKEGPYQFLLKNWKYWNLAMKINGYIFSYPKLLEIYALQDIIPQTLRIFGFPSYKQHIDPAPLGTGGVEWSICLPPHIANSLKERFNNQTIIFGPGYSFGFYSCADGLVKERGISNEKDIISGKYKPIERGILRVWEWIGNKKVYLMRRE